MTFARRRKSATVGQTLPFDGEGMITRSLKGVWEITKYALPHVMDHRCFAMYERFGLNDTPAVSLPDALMPQAHAKDGDLTTQMLDRRHRNAGSRRRTQGPGEMMMWEGLSASISSMVN